MFLTSFGKSFTKQGIQLLTNHKTTRPRGTASNEMSRKRRRVFRQLSVFREVDFRDYFAGTVSRGFGGPLWNVSQSVRILSQSCTDRP
jgi:hypothetical protein